MILEAAGAFAESPAGVVTTVLGAGSFTLMAVMLAQQQRRHRDGQAATMETVRALAMLVEKSDTTEKVAHRADRTAEDMKSAVELLRDRLDRHEKWADQQRAEILRRR